MELTYSQLISFLTQAGLNLQLSMADYNAYYFINGETGEILTEIEFSNPGDAYDFLCTFISSSAILNKFWEEQILCRL